MRNNLRLQILVLAAAVSLAGLTSARATLLAYEGFDYTANATFTGLSGGSGWSTAWALNGGNTLNSVTLAGSFTYTDINGYSLVTSGNRAHVTGDGSALGDNLPGGTAAGAQPLRSLNFNRGITGGPETTWISMLAIRTGLPNPTPSAPPADYLYGRAFGVQFFNQTTTATTAGNEQFSVGRATQSSESNTGLPNDTWSVSNQGAANAQKVSNVNMASGPADFLLIRIDHIGTTANDLANADTIRVWINPPDLNIAPSDGSADIVFNSNEFAAPPESTTRDFFFNRIRLFGGSVQTTPSGRSYGSEEIDEFRIGDTFGDVTPNAIPEPSAFAFGGLGLLVLVFRRRG